MAFSYLRVYTAFVFSLLIGTLGLKAQTQHPITLNVDATQAAQDIIHTQMTIPVSPGPLTLYYPKWIPGEHAPDGPIVNLTGLKFSGNGKTIEWHRDLVDMFAFHLNVPQGVNKTRGAAFSLLLFLCHCLRSPHIQLKPLCRVNLF